MANYLGDGPVAQAFVMAQSLPNMFRRFFAEGAFNMAFVPMFAKKLEAGEDAEGFARDAYWGMAALLVVFSVLAILAMPVLVLMMASGFVGDERFDLAVTLGRIAFPYILFISLTALLSGMLNAMGRFLATSAVTMLLSADADRGHGPGQPDGLGHGPHAGLDASACRACCNWPSPGSPCGALGFRLPFRHAGADAGTEAAGDHRRPRRAGGRRGADQPDRRAPGRHH